MPMADRDTNNAFRASGTNDLELRLDFGKMGLWQGGSLLFHGESVWGGGIDKKVGALIPTNLNAALPGSAEPGFGLDEGGRYLLSEVIFQQVLFEGKLILLAGKLWGRPGIRHQHVRQRRGDPVHERRAAQQHAHPAPDALHELGRRLHRQPDRLAEHHDCGSRQPGTGKNHRL